MNLWYWITAEFKALGLRCVAHGPEFWLVVPTLAGALAVAALVGVFKWRNDK